MFADGKAVGKPAQELPADVVLTVQADDSDRYVSRGGLKLAGALAATGIAAEGKTCLDVGQSTGGFTDCLLQAGAGRVVGVDVGHGQLHGKLKSDQRITALEGINCRALTAADLGDALPASGFDLIVGDVSFISMALVLPQLPALLAADGELLLLIKPQFEVGPHNIGKGGIVRDPTLYREVEGRFLDLARPARPDSKSLARQSNHRRRRQPRILHLVEKMNKEISIEFFPPQTPEGVDKLRATRAELAQLQPEFFSVTYGAGGSTRERTFSVVKEIAAEGFDAAPHLSCIGSTRESIREILSEYQAAGIRRIVALRGDLPSGMAETGEFRYANELVEFIPRRNRRPVQHRGRRLPGMAPAGAQPAGRPAELRAQGEGRRQLGDHPGTSTTPTPISTSSTRRARWASTSRSSQASCRSSVSPSWPASPTPAAPTCRAGCARSSRATATIPNRSAPSASTWSPNCAPACFRGGAPGLHFYSMNQAPLTLEICRRLGN